MTVKTEAGKINAEKSMLNLLATFAAEAADQMERNHMPALAAQASAIAAQIHIALDASGYYEF